MVGYVWPSCLVRHCCFIKATVIGHRLRQLLMELSPACVRRQLECVEARRRSWQTSHAATGSACYGETMLLTRVTHQRRKTQSRRTCRSRAEVEQRSSLFALHVSNLCPEPAHKWRRCGEATRVQRGCLPIVHVNVRDTAQQQLQGQPIEVTL